MSRRSVPGQAQQGGAVLIVVLIVLLVVSMLVLAGHNDALLEVRMASNTADSEVALQAAEAGLRKGERVVIDGFLDGTLYDLKGTYISDIYEGFEGVSRNPDYTVTVMSTLRTSTEVGMPVDDEGALARVDAMGYGAQRDDDNDPIAVSHLRSTVVVEE